MKRIILFSLFLVGCYTPIPPQSDIVLQRNMTGEYNHRIELERETIFHYFDVDPLPPEGEFLSLSVSGLCTKSWRVPVKDLPIMLSLLRRGRYTCEAISIRVNNRPLKHMFKVEHKFLPQVNVSMESTYLSWEEFEYILSGPAEFYLCGMNERPSGYDFDNLRRLKKDMEVYCDL